MTSTSVHRFNFVALVKDATSKLNILSCPDDLFFLLYFFKTFYTQVKYITLKSPQSITHLHSHVITTEKKKSEKKIFILEASSSSNLPGRQYK